MSQFFRALLGQSGGGGGYSTPTKFLWYKSWTGLWQDTGGTTAATANGDPIGRWDDQTGNGNHATQSVGSQKPTLDTGTTFNGNQTVLFTAANFQRFQLPDVSSLTAAELFLSIQIQNDPPAVDTKTGIYKFDAAGTLSTHYPYTDGNVYDKFFSDVRPSFNPTPSLAAWRIWNPHSATGDKAAYLDNTQVYSTASSNFETVAAPTLGEGSGSGAVYLDGWLSEVILYTGVLSSSDRTTTYNYMSSGSGSPA